MQAKTKATKEEANGRSQALDQRVDGATFCIYHSNTNMLAITLTTAMIGKAASDHGLITDRPTRPATADPTATGHVVAAITSNHNGNSTIKLTLKGKLCCIIEKP